MKRLAGLILILAALFAPATAQADTFPWGDVNCSGAVTSVDISIVVAVAGQLPRPPGCDMPIDLNCNGRISSSDISIILFIAGGGNYPACEI